MPRVTMRKGLALRCSIRAKRFQFQDKRGLGAFVAAAARPCPFGPSAQRNAAASCPWRGSGEMRWKQDFGCDLTCRFVRDVDKSSGVEQLARGLDVTVA